MTISVDLVFAIVSMFVLVIVGLFAAWRFAVMDGNDTDGFLKTCQAERDNLNTKVKGLSEANEILRVNNRRQYDMLTRRANMITRLTDERDIFRRQAEAAQAKLAAIIDTACGNYKGDVA